MIAKWIGVPYGIVIVVMAGFSKFVIPAYISSYSMWYSSYHHYSVIELTLAFGVAFGILTGFIADTFSARVSYILAALLSVVSYCLIPQFDGSSRTNQENWHYYVLVCLVFIAGQSSSLALITTVKVVLSNFQITSSPMILSILLSYWYIGVHMESSIRWSFFFGVDTKVYTIGVGVATLIIYGGGAAIMNIEEGGTRLTGASQYHLSILDKIGLTLFLVFETLMVLCLISFKLLTKEVTVATWITVILLAGNFVLPIINAEFILNCASDFLRGFTPEVEELHKLQRGKDKSLGTSIKSLKLIILFIAALLLLGSGTEIYERLSKISIAISMSYLTEYSMIWFIFGDFVTRGLLGLIYVVINIEICGVAMGLFAFEILGSVLLIIFTPSHSVILFNLACFIGGSGVGGLFVCIPLFIVQDIGRKHFGLIWGTFLFGIEFGIWLFSMIIFDNFYDKYNKDRWGRGTNTDGFITAFIISGILSFIGLILVGLVRYMDNEEVEEGRLKRIREEESKENKDYEQQKGYRSFELK